LCLSRESLVSKFDFKFKYRYATDMMAQVDLDDPDFFQPGGHPDQSRRSSLDDPNGEYRLSLDPARLDPSLNEAFSAHSPGLTPSQHLARSSWNAGMAKDLMKSRMLLGLPEAAGGGVPPHRLSNASVIEGGYTSDHTPGGGEEHERGDGGDGSGKSTSTSREGGERGEGSVRGGKGGRGGGGNGGGGGGGSGGFDEFKDSVEGSISRRPPGVPLEPLKLLRLMVDLIHGLTRQLRDECFQHDNKQHVGSPSTWVDTLGALAPRGSMPKGGLAELKNTLVPAGGESFLLMHARWKKLEQDIYHPRKGRFDISKVPDVYDAAKYDAIHNSHLDLDGLEELYRVAKCLAEGVVPNEYGTHPHSKLRIGGTIAHSLLVKLLTDFSSTREESFDGKPQTYLNLDKQSDRSLTTGERRRASNAGGTTGELGKSGLAISTSAGDVNTGDDNTGAAEGGEGGVGAGGEDESPNNAEDDEHAAALKEEEEEELSSTRLNHRYASIVGVQSPQRHVRTRLYFTSESHIHSLLNVLRYCNLEVGQQPKEQGSGEFGGGEYGMDPESPSRGRGGGGSGAAPLPSLLSHRLETLEGIGDLDYLTHIVFRMYECFNVPPTDPKRFRIEIMLSTGVCLDPFKNNIINEIANAGAAATKKEKERPGRAVDKVKGGGAAGGIGGGDIPILRQFPIQNDCARANPAAVADSTSTNSKFKAADPAAAVADPKTKLPDYLTLNDLESYLWKFRRKQGQDCFGVSHGGHSSSYHSNNNSDWNSPKKSSSSPTKDNLLGKAGL
jgi:hypothetical protein